MPQKPTRKEYDEIANEFWWCSTNVAKGIWRDELTYTKYMYDNIVQSCLVQMITWYVAQENGWTVNSGFHGKWIQKYLQPVLYESLKKTYADGNYEAMWNAMFEAGRLFRTIGTAVAEALGYHYPLEDEQRVTEYWRRVRDLPKEAEDFR